MMIKNEQVLDWRKKVVKKPYELKKQIHKCEKNTNEIKRVFSH